MGAANRSPWRAVSVPAWLLAAAFVVLGVASRWWEPSVSAGPGRPGFSVGARVYDGRVWVGWTPRALYRPEWAGQVNRHGFRYTRWSDGSGEVGAPVWAPAALLAAVAASAELARRRGRRAPGTCPRCGYDLRATPDRCPECGDIATTAPSLIDPHVQQAARRNRERRPRGEAPAEPR